MRWLGWLAGFLWVILATCAMADGPIREIDAAAPLARQAVTIASPEAERRGLDVGKYQTVVLAVDGSLIVIFRNPGPRSADMLGNPGPLPELEVRVDPEATRVIGSHFVR